MVNSFLEKPALVMNIDDFAQGLNFEREHSKAVAKFLFARGLRGEITSQMVRKMKVDTFNNIGTLTIAGLLNIFEDLCNAGLPRHTSVKIYMKNCIAKRV